MAISGTFTATGVSDYIRLDLRPVWVGISFDGGSAVIQTEVSWDGGTTWFNVGSDGTYSTDVVKEVIRAGDGSIVRLRCASHTSGTITYYVTE